MDVLSITIRFLDKSNAQWISFKHVRQITKQYI